MKLVIIMANPQSLPVFFTEQTRYIALHNVDVHTISVASPELSTFGEITGSAIHPVPLTRSPNPLQDAAALFRIWRVLRRIRPDVVHSHMPKGGLLGTAAALLARVPVRFFTLHGLRSDNEKGWRLWLIRATERFTCRMATDVLAVSRSVRQQALAQDCCDPAVIRVLHNGGCAGVNTSEFHPDRRSPNLIRDAYGIPSDAFVLCYAGRVSRAKGLEDLFAVWRILRAEAAGAWLLICGPDDREDPVSQEVTIGFAEDNRVVRINEVYRDMPAIYAAADLCVVPSHREGLGVVALEASAMRKPVVGYRTGGLVEAVIEGETGLLAALGDTQELGRAVRWLMGSGAERMRMGEQGRQFVQSHFEAIVISARLLHEYRRAARRKVSQDLTKRAMDLGLALTAGLLTLPFLAIGSLAVLLTLGTPVIFRQERGGKHGVPFTVYKLRTMDSAGHVPVVGRLLRQLSIDELPQLWNVIRGDMSLVGPRPLLASYLPRFSSFEQRRHEVLPGITGWAQVNGRNALSWADKFRLDIWYVEHRSLLVDLKILWLTLVHVLLPSWTTNEVQASEFSRESSSGE